MVLFLDTLEAVSSFVPASSLAGSFDILETSPVSLIALAVLIAVVAGVGPLLCDDMYPFPLIVSLNTLDPLLVAPVEVLGSSAEMAVAAGIPVEVVAGNSEVVVAAATMV